jgi:Tol biopolymer transport system component
MRRFRFFLVVLLLSAQALYHAQGGTPPVARNVVMTTQEGAAKTGTLLATDADGSALTFSVATAPAKGTLTIDDATTGAFTYTPSAGAAGYDAFTFRAADGTGSSTANGAVFIVANSPRWPGQTVRASVAPDGSEQTSPNTIGASASADGRVIAFSNGSANEATGEFNLNVFVHDRQTGQTTFVLGGLFPVVSPDGRYVAFTTIGSILPGGDPTAESEAVLHDRQTGQTTRISVASDGTPANGASGFTFASADGRYVAFDSTATNLVPADTDDDEDVYLHDRATGQTTLQ